ncbi:MAG TPA: hypothetical protein VGE54_07215 [Brevundimonas sp.]
MRTALSAAAIAVVALLGGCSVNLGLEPATEESAVVWAGYLEELDGVAAVDSGIRLEISNVPSEDGSDAFRYTLETGCVGDGSVGKTGDVQAFETLRPCTTQDVERMSQLNRMSFAGSSGTPDGDATLRWAGTEATLTSPLGQARFTNATARGTSE